MLVIKSGKQHMTNRMELPNQDRLERSGKCNLQIPVYLEG